MAGAADEPVARCAYGCQDTCVASNAGERCDRTASRSVQSYRPHGSVARMLYDKRKADEWLAAYDKRRWYKVDKSKIREDLLDLWIPLGAGPNADQPDKAAEIFLVRSAERSDSLPLQAWHSLARSALSWFISRTSINGYNCIAVFAARFLTRLFKANNGTVACS